MYHEKTIEVLPLIDGNGGILIYPGENNRFLSCYSQQEIDEAREIAIEEIYHASGTTL